MEQLLFRFRATTSPQDQDDLVSLVREDKKRPMSGPLVLMKRQRGEDDDKRFVSTVSAEDVFAPWSNFLIDSSIANLPCDLKLKVRKNLALEDDEGVGSILDPRFVLTQLWHLVSRRNLMNCQIFVERGGLSYALTALSSKRPCIRKISYSILQRFYRQLETTTFSSFKDRQMWLNFIDLMRCCVTQENQQLRRLRTSFYTNCISVLRDPNHTMFWEVKRLVLSDLTDDIQIAKELVKIARSSDQKNHKAAFEWALTVMAQGVDQKEDFELLDKCLAFDFLIEPASSPLFQAEEMQMVLFVLVEASETFEAVVSMCQKNALIPFLNLLIFDFELDDASLASVFRIACNMEQHFMSADSNVSDFMLFDLCQLLLSLSRFGHKLVANRAKLVSSFVNCFIAVTALTSERRGSQNWLLLCDDDMTHMRDLERQLTLFHGTQS